GPNTRTGGAAPGQPVTPPAITVDPKKLTLCDPAHDLSELTLRLLSPQGGTVTVGVSQLTTSDGCGHIPASAVTISGPRVTVGAGGAPTLTLSPNVPTTLPVTIDTSHFPSGEYVGDV